MVQQWRKVLDEKKAEDGQTRWRETNNSCLIKPRSCISLIIIVNGMLVGRPEFHPRQRQGFFSSPPCPDRLWYPSTYAMGTGALSTGSKILGCESDYAHPSSASKNAWIYTFTPL
jgi:hypothetical protein